jgi:Protein of unknown function (DUF2799)
MRFVLLASSCLMLTGCASMSKSECVYADWRAIGYEDGANGYPATAVSSRRQACAKAGVTPDMSEYLAGRDRGLEEYCTPANGFATGENGAGYNGVCGRHNEEAFLDHYRAGARLYTLRDRVRSAGYALRTANEHLGEIKFAITETTTGLIRPDLTVAQRAAEVVELTQLAQEGDRVERSLPSLQMELQLAEADLAAYEHQLASRPMLARVAVR